MIVNTKYDIEDKVYVFLNGDIYEERVKVIDINISMSRKGGIFTDITIIYTLSKSHIQGWMKNTFTEQDIFGSKKEIADYIYDKIMK